MRYSATDLRRDIYRILDRVLETGDAVEVERNGRLLRIVVVAEEAPLDRLQPMVSLLRQVVKSVCT